MSRQFHQKGKNVLLRFTPHLAKLIDPSHIRNISSCKTVLDNRILMDTRMFKLKLYLENG